MTTTRSASAFACVLGLTQGACSIPAFTCESDAQCVEQPGEGLCEADHRCSYPDGECPSGRRYGEYAGEMSRACVDAAATTESGSMSDTQATTLATSTGAATSEGSTTTSSSSSDSTAASSSESGTTGNIPVVPLGHWPLDDDGPVAMDVSGNDHHGARDGGTWVEGHIGGAIQFTTPPDAPNEHGIDGDVDRLVRRHASG